MVRMKGVEVAKVNEFKCLGSTVQNNRECRGEVKKRVQAGCDRRVPARVKGKVYKRVVRPAMLYGLEVIH